MSSERFQRAAELFEQARELAASERADLLDEACADDQALRAEVESLLKRHDQMAGDDRFEAIHQEIRDRAEAVTADRTPTAMPQAIGRYEIKTVIASGGMGTVYRAVQDHPHRVVALKVLRRGVVSPQAIRRFRHEADILGRLKHPNIAQVHDAGTFDEGEGAQPYFAMELIEGAPLTRYAESKKLGTRDRLQLFEKVCEAVQYAHHRGVIHRDLKPDNIFVDEHGEPKILDFGVARATDADIQVTTLRTDIGQLIGTIPYMSPEQVSGNPDDLDTRSDVYSLGVVLLELLTGHVPHELADKTIPEAVRIIGAEDPQRLSTIDRTLRGDLDTIVAKALEHDKTRRFQSAGELGADIGHHLADEPIAARPASTFYQLRKFARRNKTLVSGVTAVIVVLMAGIVGIGIALAQTRAEARKAALISEFLEDMLVSVDPFQGRRDLKVIELLDQSVGRIDEQFAAYPEVAVRLHLKVGSTYRMLGSFKKAETELQSAYEQGETVLGELHPDTLDALLLLTDVICKQDRTEEGIPLARLHHERRRLVMGDSHRLTINAKSLLGAVLGLSAREEDRAEAISVLRQALDQSSEAFGPDHVETMKLATGLAHTLMLEYEFEEAEMYGRRVLDRCGDRSNLDVYCMHTPIDLSVVVGLLGDPQGGAQLAEDVYVSRIDRVGPHETYVLAALYCLGLNLQWAGRAEEAERRFQEYMSFHEETPQPGSFGNFLLLRVHLLQGKVSAEEALPILEQFVATMTDPLLPTGGEMGLTALANCLVRLGRFEEAEAQMQRNPGRFTAAVSSDHFERRLYLETLAQIYEGLEEPEKAEEYRDLLRQAQEMVASD
jgi:tetratricopeptide (TPR) repeat protein/serine/threonine-protein kinase RIO1